MNNSPKKRTRQESVMQHSNVTETIKLGDGPPRKSEARAVMKLVVTGGVGFVGSNFRRRMLLKHEDINIVNIDWLSYGSNPANLTEINGDSRYRFIGADIKDHMIVRETAQNAPPNTYNTYQART